MTADKTEQKMYTESRWARDTMLAEQGTGLQGGKPARKLASHCKIWNFKREHAEAWLGS